MRRNRGLIVTSFLLVLWLLAAGVWYLKVSPADAAPAKPQPVGDLYKLRQLLQQASQNGNPYGYGIMLKSAAGQAPGSTGAADAGRADYSSTNVQVQGVDEADVVKTDGEYLYQVSNQQVIISRVYPPEQMKVASTIAFTDQNFAPQELYLRANRLVVIGNSWREIPRPVEPAPVKPQQNKLSILPYPVYIDNSTTKLFVYDISDRFRPHLERELEVEGRYISSRLIDSALYLVSSRYAGYYPLKQQGSEQSLTPSYRDSREGKGFKCIGYDRVYYFPGVIPRPNYIVVAGLNIDQPGQELDISSYLGAGENVYASRQKLYVAVTEPQVQPLSDTGKQTLLPLSRRETKIYSFALKEGRVEYAAAGSVPGDILNQFSMDEHNGYFRIATTTGEIWAKDEDISKNNIYVLNDKLAITGKLEGLAPGERIYSTRFAGDRAYMVTFRTVDPLFVIDLKDPQKPAVLGYLKIPGYSDYLHPYDENHIIGFGKDTFELPVKDSQGRDSGETMAYYAGMKISIFDVSDVTKPREMFAPVIIGDRGTYSDLLYNHKALLFSKEKNLLAFPVTVMEKNAVSQPAGSPLPDGRLEYGRFAFQGVYVYNIDLTHGLQYKGRITHLSDEDYRRAGDYWYDSNKNVQRAIYINDTLYTISSAMLKANRLSDLAEQGSLTLPAGGGK
ncbi:beta-propeller domain-containing protein [Desulfurispora thermophila]|uniref:beta-propeller domain-containing protein n=1 Tax=Desulfurispora thermophila TaxID=265470 RepID=UPI00036BADC2|nr:beta-propeller domain-containing protein [Desulfurispora thermophila]